jgi:hypothetical protein
VTLPVDPVRVVRDLVADQFAEVGEALLGPPELVVGVHPLDLVPEGGVELPVVDVSSLVVLTVVERLPCHTPCVTRQHT